MKTATHMATLALTLAFLAPRGWAADASGTWNTDGSGNWSDTSKWTTTPAGNYPNGVGASAHLTNNITAARTNTLDVSVTLGSLRIGDNSGTAYSFVLTNNAGCTITMDSGGTGPVTITKQTITGSGRAADTMYPDIILTTNLSLTVTANGQVNLNIYGAISGTGRTVTIRSEYSTAGPVLYSTNSSYSGRTSVTGAVSVTYYSIANVGGGNSSLGAPTTAENGTIDIGDGANAANFYYGGTANARTDRILKFVGTTGTLTIGSLYTAGVLTYTSPFQFSGAGAKTLNLMGVAVLGNMYAPDLTVSARAAVSGGDSRGIYLLGLNNYTNKTDVYRAVLVINSLSSVANPQPSSLGAPTTVANGTIGMSDSDTGADVSSVLKYIGIGHTSDRVVNMGGTRNTTVTLNASGYGRFILTSALTAADTGVKTLTLDGTGEGELQGAVPDGSGGATPLSKTGTGTWTLKGNNTFSGTITINGGGTLEVGHDNALNTGAMTLGSVTAGNLAAVGAARTLTNTITAILSGFGFTGSQDLTLTATIPATTGHRTLYNRLVSGKTLTLNAMNLTPDATTRTTTLEGSGDTVIGAIANGGGSGALTMSGTGTLTLKGANTYTGATALNAGGTLALDYSAQDNSKLDDSAALTLGGANMGGALTLNNSATNHIEQVGSTTLGAGGIRVSRPSGGATLRLQALTRSAGGTIDFGVDSIADVSLANVNGILGGWATVGGTNWAVGGAGNTPVTAFTGYSTPFPAAGPGSAASNYFHNVAGQAQSAVAANTLKIANGQNSDSLTLNGNLTITSTSATSLGGILYVGGYDNLYTIGGSGRMLPSTAAQELIFNVYTGTLTVSAPIHAAAAAAGSLTKSGAGRLAVNNANAFTGATRVNEGILKLQNSTALGTSSAVSVQRSAAVELEGGVTLARTLTLFGAGPDNSGALKNVSGANTWSGAIAIGTGGARIENADAGNALTLPGGITTAAGKDVTFGGAGNIIVSTLKITGAGTVTKDGAGTLELEATNDYTGPTTVNAGTLKVTGSIAAGSMVTVNSNATLSGSGRCYGEVRVKAGGTIRPEGGNLTVSNLVLYAGSVVYREAGTTNRVVVSQTGDLVFQRGLTIIGGGVTLAENVPAGTYTLIEYSGDLNGSVTNLAVLNPEAGAKYEFVNTGTAVAVKVERGAGTVLLVQ